MAKGPERPDGDEFVDGDIVDAGVRRPAPQRGFEPGQRVGVAFGFDLDAAVGQIADVSVQAFAAPGVEREEAVADALHAARDHIAPRRPHRRIVAGRPAQAPSRSSSR